jgi:hypothetical protein
MTMTWNDVNKEKGVVCQKRLYNLMYLSGTQQNRIFGGKKSIDSRWYTYRQKQYKHAIDKIVDSEAYSAASSIVTHGFDNGNHYHLDKQVANSLKFGRAFLAASNELQEFAYDMLKLKEGQQNKGKTG